MHSLSLTSGDILERQHILLGMFAPFFRFQSHSVYFPQPQDLQGLDFLSAEQSLFLPLVWKGKRLAMLRLRGVYAREIRPLLPKLAALTSLALENLALHIAKERDALTCLDTEQTFFACMEAEAFVLRESLDDPNKSSNAPLHRLCLGLGVLRWPHFENVAEMKGYAFAEKILNVFARSFKTALQDRSERILSLARLGNAEFAVLFQSHGRGNNQDLLAKMLEEAGKQNLAFALDDPGTSPLCLAGHALYPQDMLGTELALPIYEQGRRLWNKARMACDALLAGNKYSNAASGLSPHSKIMAYAKILAEGGIICEQLDHGRLKISLGQKANVREGMRFFVLDPHRSPENASEKEKIKGEIVILHCAEKESIAELVYLHDPADDLMPGDSLRLSSPSPVEKTIEAGAISGQQKQGEGKAPLSHGEFLRQFEAVRKHWPHYVLALCRVVRPKAAGKPESLANAEIMLLTEKLCAWANAGKLPDYALMGAYGSMGLILFHPEAEPLECKDAYGKFCTELASLGYQCAVGLAAHPFLDLARTESESLALKALECALLLPEPAAWLCDSIALTVGADKLFSNGDLLNAMDNYKLALLADPGNALALNSLAVCLAALGRRSEAERHLQKALNTSADPMLLAKISYNLGTLCQSNGEDRKAVRHYNRCLSLDQGHIYARLRLGQISALKARKHEARKFYQEAVFAEEQAHPRGTAARFQLAKLALAEGRREEAEELLHSVLSEFPDDIRASRLLEENFLNTSDEAVPSARGYGTNLSSGGGNAF